MFVNIKRNIHLRCDRERSKQPEPEDKNQRRKKKFRAANTLRNIRQNRTRCQSRHCFYFNFIVIYPSFISMYNICSVRSSIYLNLCLEDLSFLYIYLFICYTYICIGNGYEEIATPYYVLVFLNKINIIYMKIHRLAKSA